MRPTTTAFPGHAGARTPARSSSPGPSTRSWCLATAVGTLAQNLPSFVVIAALSPSWGRCPWSNDFLPASVRARASSPGRTRSRKPETSGETLALAGMELGLAGAPSGEHLNKNAHDSEHWPPAFAVCFETAFQDAVGVAGGFRIWQRRMMRPLAHVRPEPRGDRDSYRAGSCLAPGGLPIAASRSSKFDRPAAAVFEPTAGLATATLGRPWRNSAGVSSSIHAA